MSVILRSLLRDPLVTRPLSRALRRRFDDDFWNDDYWPTKRVRREPAVWESPVSLMNDMNRQMTAAMNRMQELTEDLDTLDSWVDSWSDRDSRPRRSRSADQALLRRTESGGLQLALDVSDFKPEDLKIKLVDDNLVIEGNSETSGKDSYRQTQFKRWFKLPEDCKLEEITSKLTSDKRLVIDLPSNKPLEQQQTRSIPIEMEKNNHADQSQDAKPAEKQS